MVSGPKATLSPAIVKAVLPVVLRVPVTSPVKTSPEAIIVKSLLGGVRTRTVPVVRPSTSKRISFVASTLPSTIEVPSPAGRLLAVSALQVTTPAAETALTLSLPEQVAAWIVVESALGIVTVRSTVGSVMLM